MDQPLTSELHWKRSVVAHAPAGGSDSSRRSSSRSSSSRSTSSTRCTLPRRTRGQALDVALKDLARALHLPVPQLHLLAVRVEGRGE